MTGVYYALGTVRAPSSVGVRKTMAQVKHLDKQLEKLITCCEDGYHGYLEAAKAVDSPDLRKRMEENAAERMQFRAELQGFNPNLHKDEAEGSTAGKVYRSWINFKEKLRVSDDEICADCVVGEKQAIDQYDEVLKDKDLDSSLRALVQRQHDKIVRHCEWMKAHAV
jgi:uncharacterized protein (TIGR02284 family)